MQPIQARFKAKLTTLVLGALAGLVVVSIILFPDKAFQSSLEGLTIWWKLVFPAFMPFLIMTELLIGFGVIHGTGVLLDPLMRIVFRLPGVSGWAVASGFVVGFPAGAKITASLREKNLLTRTETERLTALSHLCSPLFLIMVVGIGFLHSAKLGIILTIVHYLSAIVTGFLMRLRKQPVSTKEFTAAAPDLSHDSLWKAALAAMRQAYWDDGRTFGKLLGDAVSNAVQTLLLIGGYMMIFSVLINVVSIMHVTELLRPITQLLLSTMNIFTDTTPLWIKGFMEIHLGSYAFSQAKEIPLLPQMALLSAFLGWGGLSAHAQVAGFHQKSDARYLFFLQSRALHAVLALFTTIMLWKPLQLLFAEDEPSFLWLDRAPSEAKAAVFPVNGESAWGLCGPMLTQFLFIFSVMLLVSVGLRLFQRKS
ncbi:nucleoside recognition domain-containing protein [Paenibacillus roseipurpureus]|uniref:Sporulation protein n=1 Tax=Paenibacillus roseopurpureus TaxID=2918901 RepID=A0AA96LSS1_9BACL|nr:nucleoside recognition domain-containing protein [Paenibacillus sp. MBLB1832]WNR46604.1 sporulation protein [Paenibacillus sp. MBLB1832]